MILTCPSCSTRYFVNDASMAPEGQAVRCAACGAVWTAKPEIEAELDEPVIAAPEVEDDPEPADAPADPLAVVDDGTIAPPPPIPTAPSRGAMVLASWGALCGAVIGLIAAAAMFREDVVSVWPKTASVYGVFGVTPGETALVLNADSVTARRIVEDGQEILEVRAEAYNPKRKPQPAPLLRVRLKSADGDVVMERLVDPDADMVAADGAAVFTLRLADPPPEAADLEASFADIGGHAAAPKAPVAGQLATEAGETEAYPADAPA